MSAAIELPRGLRINAVDPAVIEQAMPGGVLYFRGCAPVLAARAAMAFVRGVEDPRAGQVHRVGG